MLTSEGVRAAVEIGSRLAGGYEVLVSTGAQQATQRLACFLAGLGEKVPQGVVVGPGLRSGAEDRWRAATRRLGATRSRRSAKAGPGVVEEDSAVLATALRRILDGTTEGGRALVAGHSPTNEAAVFGLAGHIVEPISKGGGVLVVEENGAVRIETLVDHGRRD